MKLFPQNMPAFAALFMFMIAESPTSVAAKGFLVERRGSIRGSLDASSFERELNTALGEALGSGGSADLERRLAEVQQRLAPIWSTLPKNGAGNLERRSLRYLVHRHFSRQSALQIRGFEPSRPANASGWGSDDILAQRVPAFVEAFLESNHKLERGFNLGDAARVVATIEQLIFDFEGSVLQKVYEDQRKPLSRSLSRQGMEQLLESYMVRWMLGEDEEGIRALSKDPKLLRESIPHWDQIVSFANGQAKALDYRRQQSPAAALAAGEARPGHNALAPKYSFEDVHGVVGGITKSFASFWDSECRSMKSTLVEMDTHHTGRLPLSKFYSHGLDTEWRFGESEEYLRDLGALDETSLRGKQVIIPNYIQATSNCIISSQHYLVCCVNDCDGVLDEIESQIGSPSAEPIQILAVMGNMSAHGSSLDEDHAPQLEGSLTSQLELIASAHGGQVPLHGRLFAQWLHYAFPRECPFPHKTGAVAALTPMEYGERYIASAEDMKAHAAQANASDSHAGLENEDLHWMSQWSAEEELIADYAAMGLRAPWQQRSWLFTMIGGLLGFLVVVAGVVGVAGSGRKVAAEPGLLPHHGKAHFV
mmetsp:Transcript_114733/g.364718  ORF Transcript_114733/g.364718 Transcript_114733/m.364718 type:complete len:593 (-) Transcript_114733:156-1934(-)